ncbi:hypothetical protein EUTSA_v10014011mg [Eutrema salsugineum]|uniref:Hydroxyproline-rich glycoprotein family protein n=1 Tax=Eutrema salsugineum TaxID=72664 RepID=V4LLN5_EUTSA|nr:proline-rich receptor-like protein kinase PERK2 [Eutrema salsugineum]ESQ43377.1 hypothetical protein EUTSA_v10014011mg [Eutrema salsugineum]
MEPKETEPPRKQLRQPPSVPFIWEERPGLPKKNWQPSLATFVPSPPPLPPPIPVPVKLVTSVPFRWEQTPGKPLPSSSNDPPQLPHPPLETATAPPLPPPVPVPVKLVTSVPFVREETPGQPYPCFVDTNQTEPLDQPLPPPPMYGEVETNSDIYDDASSDSFSSVPSLLTGNRSVPVSGAVTVDEFDENLNRETSSVPTSPGYESDDSTSSYMTGASSLVGASFLEKLFPRLLPHEKVEAAAASSEDHLQVTTRTLHEEVKLTTASDNMNIGFPVRTPQTLGELIMMSRRRSYMRRAVEMRKHNPSKDFTRYGAESCCLFVPGIKMIEGLEWKKYQPRLKLI